jgi:RNA polymerase sigma-70 factor (ECF subfamily)
MNIDELVHEHTEPLLKGAMALGFSVEEAQDLVQSVWLTFIEVQEKFEGRSHVRTFLFGILYNKAKEKRRSDHKLVPDERIDDLVNSYFDEKGRWQKPPRNPEQFLQASQTMHIIEECIEKLPLNQRMAFCLHEIDKFPSKDICKIIRVTVTNLGVILFRAKARLRECIEGKANGGENI